ncbi:hypothetical protein ARAM_003862 [Aspergillus rambellii]|uniref:Lysine-specific histone demethylase Aof2 n=1 Tax=Aspergillus rambellii TaxID=308745 RepID=A0A0F8XRT3_9EURO|nr:hypothetical protein ARAM_003862 [Aspergillus rambellii]
MDATSPKEKFHQDPQNGASINSHGQPAEPLNGTLVRNELQLPYPVPASGPSQNGDSVAHPNNSNLSNGLGTRNSAIDDMNHGHGHLADIKGNLPNESTTASFFSTPSQGKSSTAPSTNLNSMSSAPTPADSRTKDIMSEFANYRPRSSIPVRLPAPVYAQQCVAAAYASRLNPYALHQKEQEALQDHLCHLHVTVYLNIRNGILRLWTRNPMVSVTKEEALGCAKDYRWMNLASFAYDWLVRNGYINFGCVEIPVPLLPPKKGRRKEGPIIVVIGAGMAGLGCARQLEGFFNHYRDTSTTPRVFVLEGRRRLGGRIYSHPLQGLQSSTLPPGLVPKAEMGAQIVVGFDHGNPLDQIIRGQLALSYHLLRDISTIYDIDGSPVDEVRDAMDERLYNDVLDRSGLYRHKSLLVPTAEGDRDLVNTGRDTSISDGVTVRQYEEARAAGTVGLLLPAKRLRRGVGHKTAEIKPTGAPVPDLDPAEEPPAAFACQTMGWKLNEGISPKDNIDLDPVAKASQFQTLGNVMDEGVHQYQRMLPLTPKDMRLINWHLANLEYANATNISRLSLSGWDQDMGNEFEGEHSQVIGGFQQVPYGLWSSPTKLDVRTNKIVTSITYSSSAGSAKQKAIVHCDDGDSITADMVVYTGSLGTLKHRTVQFSPPLPEWKLGAIDRLGFGVMNKVILAFDQPFWDTERDMFGLLREPKNRESMVQEDYAANRAHQAECTPDAEIITEVMSQLRNVFKNVAVPDPLETIITRWGTDKFTKGSYSYVAAQALPGDYDLMAKSIGNLHFAGEATCGTHPATVHGAYLSGLRAASQIINSILGPIQIPEPLVPDKGKTVPLGTGVLAQTQPHHIPLDNNSSSLEAHDYYYYYYHPNHQQSTPQKPPATTRAAYEQAMLDAVYAETGPPIPRPTRSGLNPFLLYQKDFWPKARSQCDTAHQTTTKDPTAKAPRDAVRQALGLMWRQASEEEKRPYLEQAALNRQANAEISARWRLDSAQWAKQSSSAKKRWREANPFEFWLGAPAPAVVEPPTGEEPPLKKLNPSPSLPVSAPLSSQGNGS